MKCCARCKSPYGCANGACACHSLLRAALQRTDAVPVYSPLIDGEILIPVAKTSDSKEADRG